MSPLVLSFDHLVDCLVVTFGAASDVAASSSAAVQAAVVTVVIAAVLMKSVDFVFVVGA